MLGEVGGLETITAPLGLQIMLSGIQDTHALFRQLTT